MAQSVLVIEDDPSIQEIVSLILRSAGFDVASEADGNQAMKRFHDFAPDVVVLDLMLPGRDGFSLCEEIRRTSSVAIVVLTARSGTGDLVRALEVGADDYVTKPFEGPELLARIRAVLRRSDDGDAEPAAQSEDLSIDPATWRAHVGDIELDLSATEFRLLLELVTHRGQVLTREVLLQRVWEADYLGDSRLVDMAVKRLRSKVEKDPRNPVRIATVRGVGYRFEH